MAETTIAFSVELAYRDPEAALEWLSRAFGFQTRILVTDAAGKLVFAESETGGGAAGIIPAQAQGLKSPADLGGSSCTVHIRFPAGGVDIDEHFERAKAAGAGVLFPPTQQFFGDKEYLVTDPEGHLWNFGVRGADGPPGPPPEGWTVRFPGGRPA